MELEFNVEKNCGLGFSNLLRQYLIETSKSVKPIAFLLSDGSSLYMPSDDNLDVVDFASNLADLTIVVNSSVELPLTMEYTFKGQFTSKQMCNSTVTVEEDVVLLNNINPDKSVTLSVVFDEGCGYSNSESSRKRLESMGIGLKGFQTISARYSDTIVGLDVKADLNTDIVKLTIESKSGSENEKLRTALALISNHVTELSKKL